MKEELEGKLNKITETKYLAFQVKEIEPNYLIVKCHNEKIGTIDNICRFGPRKSDTICQINRLKRERKRVKYHLKILGYYFNYQSALAGDSLAKLYDPNSMKMEIAVIDALIEFGKGFLRKNNKNDR